MTRTLSNSRVKLEGSIRFWLDEGPIGNAQREIEITGGSYDVEKSLKTARNVIENMTNDTEVKANLILTISVPVDGIEVPFCETVIGKFDSFDLMEREIVRTIESAFGKGKMVHGHNIERETI